MNALELARDGWPCPTGSEMTRIDSDAIGRVGLPGRVLMESAGRSVAECIARRFPEAHHPLVVCGSGNNGGDGLVVARVLREWNSAYTPRVWLVGSGPNSEEARANLDLLEDAGIDVEREFDSPGPREALAECDLIVDAIFGVGLSRPVSGEPARLIEQINASGRELVSVDLPSGLCSDTGTALGICVEATHVVTLGLPKLGLALQPLNARIEIVDIGLPRSSIERAGVRQRLLTERAAAALLPSRPAAAHKGSFGHVLVVGGSVGKTGAVALAAEGALRSGAGLVTAAVARELNPVLEIRLTEAMTLGLDEVDSEGILRGPAVEEVGAALAGRDSLVLGPGLGQSPEASTAVTGILARCELPTVVDADALNALAGYPERLRGSGARVLTPHPGEAARLLGNKVAAIQADRVAAARELASGSGAVVLLKGARSVIASPEGEVWINPTGGPGLASGGTGDVLAGVVGGLLAQGLPAFEAARLGAYLHGAAGDLGPDAGGLASEVAARLPVVRRALEALGESNEHVRSRSFPL